MLQISTTIAKLTEIKFMCTATFYYSTQLTCARSNVRQYVSHELKSAMNTVKYQ